LFPTVASHDEGVRTVVTIDAQRRDGQDIGPLCGGTGLEHRNVRTPSATSRSRRGRVAATIIATFARPRSSELFRNLLEDGHLPEPTQRRLRARSAVPFVASRRLRCVTCAPKPFAHTPYTKTNAFAAPATPVEPKSATVTKPAASE